jgi:His/Glu/Gln/Arg/opine family amino acid ABC transporter permease subunit
MTALVQLIDEAPRFFTYWNMLFLGQAALNTLLVSLLGCFIGYVGGFLIATLRLARVMPFAPLRGLLIAWTEAIRRIPFLVLLMCVFFAFQLSGANRSLFFIAVTAVALRMSALAAENIRAGYEAVHATGPVPHHSSAGMAGDPAAFDDPHREHDQGDVAGISDRLPGAHVRRPHAEPARLLGADLLRIDPDSLLRDLVVLRPCRPLRRTQARRGGARAPIGRCGMSALLLHAPGAWADVTVDGAAARLPEGMNLAAALLASGSVRLRRSPHGGAPRGAFCFMGACQECAIHVDGELRQACLTLVRAGMAIELRGVR